MARNCDGDVVDRTGSSDRPRRLRPADPSSNVRIRSDLSSGNIPHRSPNSLLKGCTTDVERQIEAESRRLDKADYPRDKILILLVAADQVRSRKAVLEIPRQLIGIVPHQDRRDPFCARCHKDRAERGLTDRKAKLFVSAALTVLRRRHAEHPGGLLVESAARIEAGAIDYFSHRLTLR